MKKLLITLISVLVLASCASKNIYNIENSNVPEGVTVVQVEKSIVKALITKGWKVKEKTEGRIVANILVRSHTAEIEIVFDQKQYSIHYLNSTNLKYNAKKNTIHKNYNNWIIYIDRLIQTSLVDYSYSES